MIDAPAIDPVRPRRARPAARAAATLAGLCAALALGGCGTSQPGPISASELAEAQTFPYFRVYWVGPSFDGQPLAAADGLKSYDPGVGDGVYYGDCVQGKGLFGGGSSCPLPLQVTTVIYVRHSNSSFGAQRNLLLRGVPATAYNGGRALEIYSGRVAIDIFSDTPAHALQAAAQLRPLNAPGSASGDLPLPVYCPGLWGPIEARLARVLDGLPGHACQQATAEEAYIKQVNGRA
ncbi:MAG TPA: hypothetical protein VMF09_16730 [Solirubrobacteraceae bacterium]|nr:hypothetical protein [Solirubrobacteraceae bacterium]